MLSNSWDSLLPLGLVPSTTRLQLQKISSVAGRNCSWAAATACATAWRKTPRAGARLNSHDMGPSDWQRWEDWASSGWKEHKQGERSILDFAKLVLLNCLCWGLFCELGQVHFRKCTKAGFFLTDYGFEGCAFRELLFPGVCSFNYSYTFAADVEKS